MNGKKYQKPLGSSHGILAHKSVARFCMFSENGEPSPCQAWQKPSEPQLSLMCPWQHDHSQRLATEMHPLPLSSGMNSRCYGELGDSFSRYLWVQGGLWCGKCQERMNCGRWSETQCTRAQLWSWLPPFHARPLSCCYGSNAVALPGWSCRTRVSQVTHWWGQRANRQFQMWRPRTSDLKRLVLSSFCVTCLPSPSSFLSPLPLSPFPSVLSSCFRHDIDYFYLLGWLKLFGAFPDLQHSCQLLHFSVYIS